MVPSPVDPSCPQGTEAASHLDVLRCIEEALQTAWPWADPKGVELVCDLPVALPTPLRGDRGAVRRVLDLLLERAVATTDRGHVAIRATVDDGRAEDTGAWLRVEIQDTGLGLRAEEAAALEHPTAPLDLEPLAVARARQVVEAIGGTLTAEGGAVPGNGAVLRWQVPIEVPSDHVADPDRIRRASFMGRRAALAVSQERQRSTLTRLLRRWGFEVFAPVIPEDALDLLRRGAPIDVFVLDARCRGLAPGQVLRATPEDRAPACVWLEAQVDDHSDRIACRRPVRQAVLARALAQALGVALEDEPEVRAAPAMPLPPGTRVLLAEDQAVHRKLAERMLEELGVAFEAVPDGEAALEAVRRTRYDVVLMDVQMPIMDGIEATRRMRLAQEGTERPVVVALTANTLPGDREACLQAGMNEYLPKPLGRDALREMLERVARILDEGPAARAQAG